MNSYTNIHNMAIRDPHIWRSGCSRSVRRRSLRLQVQLWRLGASHRDWVSEWRRVTKSVTDSVTESARIMIEAGCGEWRRAVASDCRDGHWRLATSDRDDGRSPARRVTTVRGEWLWLRRVRRVGPRRGEWWTASSCEWRWAAASDSGRGERSWRCEWRRAAAAASESGRGE